MHSLCWLFCEETCQLVARCDKASLNQQILSRRVTCELWLTGEKQRGFPCGASCVLGIVGPPATHQLKSKASPLMSTLGCLIEAELGQLWVSSFLRTALKQERIREEGNCAHKLLREKQLGEYEVCMSSRPSCGFSQWTGSQFMKYSELKGTHRGHQDVLNVVTSHRPVSDAS